MSAEAKRRFDRLLAVAARHEPGIVKWMPQKSWRVGDARGRGTGYVRHKPRTMEILEAGYAAATAAAHDAAKPKIDFVTPDSPRWNEVLGKWAKIGERFLQREIRSLPKYDPDVRYRSFSTGTHAGKTYFSNGHWLVEVPPSAVEGLHSVPLKHILADEPVEHIDLVRLPTPESAAAYAKWLGRSGSTETAAVFSNQGIPTGMNVDYFAMMLAQSPHEPFRQKHTSTSLSPVFKGGQYGDPLTIVMPLRLD